jgi:hypothetical protein
MYAGRPVGCRMTRMTWSLGLPVIGLRSNCGRTSRATRITRSVADSRFGTALLGNSQHSGRRPVRDDSGVFCKAGLWGSSPSVKTLALPHRPSSNVLDVFVVRFESVDQTVVPTRRRSPC